MAKGFPIVYPANIRADPTQGTARHRLVTATLLPSLVPIIVGLGTMFTCRVRHIRWTAYACALTLTTILAALVLYPIWWLTFGQG